MSSECVDRVGSGLPSPCITGWWVAAGLLVLLKRVSTCSAVTCWLALRMQRVDVHWEMEFVADDLLVLACEFVGTVDALSVPVCPVQTVFKHSDSKWVREACNKHPIWSYNQVQQDSC